MNNILSEILKHEASLNPRLITDPAQVSCMLTHRENRHYKKRDFIYPYKIEYNRYNDLKNRDSWIYLIRLKDPIFHYRCECKNCKFILGIDYCDGLSLDYYSTHDSGIDEPILVELQVDTHDQTSRLDGICWELLKYATDSEFICHYRYNENRSIRSLYWRYHLIRQIIREDYADKSLYFPPTINRAAESMLSACKVKTVQELAYAIVYHHDHLVRLMGLCNNLRETDVMRHQLPDVEKFIDYHYPEDVSIAIDKIKEWLKKWK